MDHPARGQLSAFLKHFRIVVFLAAAAIVGFSTRVDVPVEASPELFHEGEYTGSLWHMKAFAARKASYPLLIHGAMDFIPSQLAHQFYGSNRIIGGTRVVNTLIVMTAWMLFMEMIYRMFPEEARPGSRIGWALLWFALLSPPLFSLPVQVTESFVGIRDVFLLGLTLVFLHYWKCQDRWKTAFLIAGSVSTGLALFWSYDRGLMAMGFTGLMLLGMGLHRRWKDAAILSGSLIAAGLVLGKTEVFGSLAGNARNLAYWITQSKTVWGLPFNFDELGSILGGMLIFVVLAVGLLVIPQGKPGPSGHRPWLLWGLLLIQLLLAKSSLNRPGHSRVLMALYPSILILVYLGSRIRHPRPATETDDAILHPGSLMALLLAFTIIPLQPVTGAWQTFVRTLTKPRPDSKLVPPELNELCAVLKENPDARLFGWSNEGVLQLLARKQWCTWFSYAIYTAPEYEAQLLTELQQAAPNVIVAHPGAWAMQVDGRSMQSRLPLVAKYIEDHYPKRRQIGSYLLYEP
jgi:hypothetical protein